MAIGQSTGILVSKNSEGWADFSGIKTPFTAARLTRTGREMQSYFRMSLIISSISFKTTSAVIIIGYDSF
jgi:hypothetical protein